MINATAETLSSDIIPEETQAPVTTPEPKSHEEVAEEASASFQGLLPYVKKLGNGLGGQKSLTRVLYAFMAYPLETAEPRLLGKAEKQLFQLLQDIAASKAFLMNYYAAEMMEKKQEEIAARKAAESEENGSKEEIVAEDRSIT